MMDDFDIIARCMKREYIIIVGAEDIYSENDRHNKLMFAQSAVRYCKRYAYWFDRTTVFYFKGACTVRAESPDGGTYYKDGYTNNQITALKDSVQKYGAVFKEAKTWDDIAAHVNNTQDKIDNCEKRVQVIIFFTHGTPEEGIRLSASTGQYLNQKSQLSIISPHSFLPSSGLSSRRYSRRHVTSWACQTANSGDDDLGIEKNMSKSLAQRMADTWNIPVYASATRTSYSAVFAGGIQGKLDDWLGDRRFIDGVLWEDDGADGAVESIDSASTSNVEEGMWILNPKQTSDYKEGHFH